MKDCPAKFSQFLEIAECRSKVVFCSGLSIDESGVSGQAQGRGEGGVENLGVARRDCQTAAQRLSDDDEIE